MILMEKRLYKREIKNFIWDSWCDLALVVGFFFPVESDIGQHICLKWWTVSLCVFSSSGKLLSMTFNCILSFEKKEWCHSLDHNARMTSTNESTACMHAHAHNPLAILERTSIDSVQGRVSAPSHRHHCDVLSVCCCCCCMQRQDSLLFPNLDFKSK